MTDSATTPPSQPMAVLPGGEVTENGPMLAADGRPLKHSLNRALRREKLRAFLLISPLLVFILVAFVAPIAEMLFRSVENQIVSETPPASRSTRRFTPIFSSLRNTSRTPVWAAD